MRIEILKNNSKHMETVISWLNNEFGMEKSKEFYRDIIEHSLVEGELPITFIAVENDELIGTVGVWRGDLLSRQDLFPWLSALVVREDYRNQGIGRALQEYVLEYTKRQCYKEIYLYTEIENYYEKMGWRQIDLGYEYSGTQVKIYSYKF